MGEDSLLPKKGHVPFQTLRSPANSTITMARARLVTSRRARKSAELAKRSSSGHFDEIAKFTSVDVFFADEGKDTMGDRRKGRRQA